MTGLDRRLVLAAAFATAATCPAAAQEKITLRLAESLPQGHVIHELVAKPFMELVTKATNGQVTFQHYPAEQLARSAGLFLILLPSVPLKRVVDLAELWLVSAQIAISCIDVYLYGLRAPNVAIDLHGHRTDALYVLSHDSRKAVTAKINLRRRITPASLLGKLLDPCVCWLGPFGVVVGG